MSRFFGVTASVVLALAWAAAWADQPDGLPAAHPDSTGEQTIEHAAESPQLAGPQSDGELIIGPAIRYRNLALFPVTSRTLRDRDRFITLDEGLKAGTIEIRELGAGRGVVESPFADDSLADDKPAELTADEEAALSDAADSAEPEGAGCEQPAGEDDGPAASARVSEPAAGGGLVFDDDDDAAPQPEAALPQAAAPQSESAPGPAPTAAANDAGLDVETLFDDELAGNDVNHLVVINRSDRPLYLMPGEIIIGGDQDRAIGQEYVIERNGLPVKIEVFCVEHGRWGARDGAEMANMLVATTAWVDRRESESVDVEQAHALATEAADGKFVGSAGSLNKRARVAVQAAEGQEAVWEQVARENDRSGVQVATDSFTAQYADRESADRLSPYFSNLESQVAEIPQIVGVIVAVNGEVDSADVLESTPLFLRLWPKLLKSYALDAANAAEDEGAGEECSPEAAVAFLAELQAVEEQPVDGGQPDRVAMSRHTSERLSAFSASMGGMGMGGMGGGAIHTSGFAK